MPQRQVVVGGSSPTVARQGPVTHAAAAHAAATLVMCRRAAGGAPVTHMACVGNLPATGWNTTTCDMAHWHGAGGSPAPTAAAPAQGAG